MLKNCLNLYTRKTLKGGEDMKKPTQTQTQTQTQIQAQAQQAKPLEGGAAMKKEQLQQAQQTNQNQAQIYFVTFVNKVDSQTAKEIIKSLRERFPQIPIFIFTPKPPPRGRRVVLDIKGTLVIVTIPYTLKNPDKQEQPPQNPESPSGFTLAELIKKK